MISLPDLRLLEIAGTDAVNFAHAQFSSDVRALANGAWQWSAWLSPQGRVRAFFQLLRDDDEHLRLLLRGGDVEALRGALAPYVLRAKVSLRAVDTPVFGTYQGTPGTLALPGSPPRWLDVNAAAADADSSLQARETWRLDDIRAGLPVLADNLVDQLLPQWLGLDRLGATSVKKGCYPGQEVMSRLHFKGGNKRSLYRVEFADHETPAPGFRLKQHDADGAEIGLIVMSARRADGVAESLASLLDAAAAAGTTAAPAGFTVLQRFS